MNKTISVIICTISIFASCSKSMTSNPPPTDSTVTVKADTSTLVKSITTYSYDASGNTIIDSTLAQQKFDNNRRLTSYIFIVNNGQTKDTSSFFYTTTKTINTSVTYSNNLLVQSSSDTTMLGASGKPDSSTSNGFSNSFYNGVYHPQNSSSITYYLYDQDGNDTLETNYNLSDQSKVLASIVRKVYTDNSLDSSIIYRSGQISSFDVYLNGNVVSDAEYIAGDTISHSYTYYDILSGGLFPTTGTRNLLKTFTQTISNPPSTDVENFVYEFDSASRVVIATVTKANILYSKTIYTYY